MGSVLTPLRSHSLTRHTCALRRQILPCPPAYYGERSLRSLGAFAVGLKHFVTPG